MDRSALSGKEIEDGQTSRIIVSFDDGTSREVTVSAEEATDLRSKGGDVSPWYVHLGRKVTRPGVWLLGIAVTSLLIPAITKQWADRPREIELRTRLIDSLGESAAQTVNTARFIVADTLPDAALRQLICTRALEAEEEGRPDPELEARCEAARETERRAEQTEQIEAKNAWLQKGAVLESQLATYFPHTDLAPEGKRYVDAVRLYLFLASGVCEEQREIQTRKLLRLLGRDPDAARFQVLYLDNEEDCEHKSDNLEFRKQYGPLGDQLLARRLDLLTLLNDSKAAGFSTGLADFLVDALPALVLLAAALAYVSVYAWATRRRFTRPPPRSSTMP